MNIKLKLFTSSINLHNQHFLRKSPQGWLTLAICLQYSHMTELLFCTIAKLEINTNFLSVEDKVSKFLPRPLFLFSFSVGLNVRVYVCIPEHIYIYTHMCVYNSIHSICMYTHALWMRSHFSFLWICFIYQLICPSILSYYHHSAVTEVNCKHIINLSTRKNNEVSCW